MLLLRVLHNACAFLLLSRMYLASLIESNGEDKAPWTFGLDETERTLRTSQGTGLRFLMGRRRLGSRPVPHGQVLLTVAGSSMLRIVTGVKLFIEMSRAEGGTRLRACISETMGPLGLIHLTYSAQAVTHFNVTGTSENEEQNSLPPHRLR